MVMPETRAPFVPCVGCGGMVPDIDGPVHAYMRCSPGCWQWYGEVTALTSYRPGASAEARSCLADCFAVQHPGGAETDRRQRGSVAVHLTALCLARDFGLAPRVMSRLRQTMSARVLPRLNLETWPYLPPPESKGEVTVADARSAAESEVFDEMAARWMTEAWRAWRPHHDTVRTFAEAALSSEK
jgi:hypothetical protein